MNAAHVMCIFLQVLQTTPGCPVLSGRPSPSLPTLHRHDRQSPRQEYTSVYLQQQLYLCRLLDWPQHSTQKEVTAEMSVSRSAVPLGWDHWHSLSRPGVPGKFRADSCLLSRVLWVSFPLLSPNEMSSRMRFEKSTNSLGNTGSLS